MKYGVFISVFGKLAGNILAGVSGAVTLGETALDHKVAHYSVERKSVVEMIVYETYEIIHRLRRCRSVKLKHDRAVILDLHLNVNSLFLGMYSRGHDDTDDDGYHRKNYTEDSCLIQLLLFDNGACRGIILVV